MGIGTEHSLEQALTCSVYAGQKGSISSILTSVSLFEALQKTAYASPLLQQNRSAELDVPSLIEQWWRGEWETPTSEYLDKIKNANGCSLHLPSVYSETPAARGLCSRHPAIREKLSVEICTCSLLPGVLHPRKDSQSLCGWQLLKRLAELLPHGVGVADTNMLSLHLAMSDCDNITRSATAFRDSNGYTLLHYAAASLAWDQLTLMRVIDALVLAGVNIRERSDSQESSVLMAIKAGNSGIAIHLLEKYCALEGEDVSTECLESLSAGEWDLLDILLDKHQSSSQTERLDINSLLMKLCSTPRLYREMVGGDQLSAVGIELLIKHGGDIRYRDEQHVTLLMASLKAANSDFAQYILDKVTNDPTIDGQRPEELDSRTVNRMSDENLKYLNSVDIAGETALSESIRHGNKALTFELLNLNVDLDWRIDTRSVSALQIACQTLRYLDYSEIIDELLAPAPEAINIEDRRGNSILHYLAFGADGRNTIHAMEYALSRSRPETQLINKRNTEGQTPLHFAVAGGVVSNVQYLLMKGAQIADQDVRGYTALHLATDDYGENNYEIFSVLLNAIKDPNIQVLNIHDQWGRTALMYAAGKLAPRRDKTGKDVNGNDAGKPLLLLLERASPELRDNYGQNVLHHYYGRRAEDKFRGLDYVGMFLQLLRMLIVI
jgi:ankyrin repeat protein